MDLGILDLLQRDAHATQAEIARKVGLTQPSVAERVRKLERDGVIVGYVARVDPKKLGKDISAFVSVDIDHPRHFDGFARKVMELADVLECHRVAGAESYVLRIRTDDTEALDRLLVQELRTIPGVTRTHTTIVLATVKEDSRISPTRGGER